MKFKKKQIIKKKLKNKFVILVRPVSSLQTKKKVQSFLVI